MKRRIEGDTIHLMDGALTVLSMEEIMEPGKALVRFSGNLCSDTVHDVKDELMAMTMMGVEITLDLQQVQSICAACQHVFLQIQQKIDERGKGRLILTKLPDAIFTQLDEVGLTSLLEIE